MIKLFDRTNIDQIQWPDTKESKNIQNLILPMMKHGVEKYIKNIETSIYILQIDNFLLPITVNKHEYNNSYVTSNYFFITYLLEKLDHKFPRAAFLAKPAIKLLGIFLKIMQVNRVVIINNWLLTTNTYPNLTAAQIEKITQFLQIRFNRHSLIWRGVNTHTDGDLIAVLKACKYRMVGSRYVHIYDPGNKGNLSSKVLYHHRRDRILLQKDGYEVVSGEQMCSKDIKEALELYNDIYINRYTKYSPQYTDLFVTEVVKSRFFDLICLKKEGALRGVLGCHESYQTMILPFFGYDTSYGEPNHLYRILTMIGIDESEKRGVVLNDSSGSSSPKKYRGMKLYPEYVACYDKHLPIWKIGRAHV